MGRRFSLRALGHEQLEIRMTATVPGDVVLKMRTRATANPLQSAPASAWLRAPKAHDANARFILDCVGCHQVPAPQFRNYANAMADIPGTDRADNSRRGYAALVQYMNYLSAQEFSRGSPHGPPEASNVYSVGNGERVVNFLAQRFPGRMDAVAPYAWGAPLAVTSRTVIHEYEVAAPNAIREAVLMGGDKPQLYIADVASNRIIKLDPATGRSQALEIPHTGPVGPHSLHRGPDGSLWVAPFVTSVVARLDLATERWQTWPMRTSDGTPTGIHDLSFGANHELKRDAAGNVWYSDIVNNAVGYFNPETGDAAIYKAPLPAEGPARQRLALRTCDDR